MATAILNEHGNVVRVEERRSAARAWGVAHLSRFRLCAVSRLAAWQREEAAERTTLEPVVCALCGAKTMVERQDLDLAGPWTCAKCETKPDYFD